MSAPILCGVDDSKGGREAAVAAAALAQRLEAELICVHIATDGPTFPYGDAASRERNRRHAFREGLELLAEVTASLELDGDPAYRVRFGRPAKRLSTMAVTEGAQMLVVGSRGRGPLTAALLGSVSRELISLAPCPVLVVPAGATAPSRHRRRGYKVAPSVVCGVDGSPEAGHAARTASQLARRMGDRLVLAHAVQPLLGLGHDGFRRDPASPPQVAQWRVGFKYLDAAATSTTERPKPEFSMEAGEPTHELVSIASRQAAELLVLGSRGQSGLRAGLLGSVAGTLAGSAPVPVLIVSAETDAASSSTPARARPSRAGSRSASAPRGCAYRASRARSLGGGPRSSC
jgi:nucleotide-binding universal stress UspA family protein